MYRYRKMTAEERAAIVAHRRSLGRSWHAPPHLQGLGCYMVTAACYQHQAILTTEARRTEWEETLLQSIDADGLGQLFGWVVLPNHYHLLVQGDLNEIGHTIGRLHNGKSTQWNREDDTPGRKVWFRFADRAIRSERHFYTSLNYIHANPVKHGYVDRADDWPWCSLRRYLEQQGRELLADWWQQYPPRNYGKGWDD
jgi:putative transposase